MTGDQSRSLDEFDLKYPSSNFGNEIHDDT